MTSRPRWQDAAEFALAFGATALKKPRIGETSGTGDITPRYTTMGRRQRNIDIGPGYFSSRSRRRIGRRRRPTAKLALTRAIGQGQEVILRWQNTSQTVMGPGKFALGWFQHSTAGFERVPFHFMSLSNNSIGLENSTKGCSAKGMRGCYYKPADGSFAYEPLPVATNTGAIETNNPIWQTEKNTSPVGLIELARQSKSVLHKWSKIKLNLYGTYSVPITYSVYLMTLSEQLDPLLHGDINSIPLGTECSNFLRDVTRPLLYSNLGINAKVTWPKDCRIVKSEKITIQPLSYSDQEAEAFVPGEYSKAPHIHMLNWFIRHDRMREYDWTKNASGGGLAPDLSFNNQGWDVVYSDENMCDCEWGKKLFLVITATSPKLDATPTPDPLYASTETCKLQGSYDVSIRNCFRFFS